MKARPSSILLGGILSALLLVALGGCASTATPIAAQPGVTVNPTFQAALSPIPTTPPYRCGAWSSNNAPGSFAQITIYARITRDIAPVSGATASAVVHFQATDLPLAARAPSDDGGYVTFTLQLQGRQPGRVPATVDVTFSNVPGDSAPLHCTPAFFTPV
jgi:hypothetical protein